MGDELSDQEKLEITSRFLLSSPPGEFLDVLTDVRGLVANDQLLNQNALNVFKTYNVDQMITATLPDGSKTLVTKFGEIDGENYLDPMTKQVFTFDHVKSTVTSVRDASAEEINQDLEPFRAACQVGLVAYLKTFYDEAASCAVYANTNDKGENAIIACISGCKLSPQNFWNGRWRSTWTMVLNGGKTEAKVTGVLKLLVHYYEGGNVQMTSSKQLSDTWTFSDATSCGETVAKGIWTLENAWQASLETNHEHMNTSAFKALRRKMPVTGTKFPWEKQAYKLARELRE